MYSEAKLLKSYIMEMKIKWMILALKNMHVFQETQPVVSLHSLISMKFYLVNQ